MIGLPVYALVIPLCVVLVSTVVLSEMEAYSSLLDEVGLAVDAHALADRLVASSSGMARSQEIVEDEVKVWPNVVDGAVPSSAIPAGRSVGVWLDGVEILRQGGFDQDVHCVTRIVLYEARPAPLRVCVGE